MHNGHIYIGIVKQNICFTVFTFWVIGKKVKTDFDVTESGKVSSMQKPY